MDLFERTPGSRDRYIATLVSLGVVYRQQGKKRLAELTFRRVLRDNGDASPRSILSLEFLAVLLAQQKRCGEAAQLANRARGIVQDTFGDGSLPLASALATVAFVEQHARDFENAEQHYAQALRIMREQNMLNSSAGLDFANQYAIVLRKRHRGRELKSLNAELDAFRSVATAAN
jgi:tetratricopeptide (TPR) repeat protein